MRGRRHVTPVRARENLRRHRDSGSSGGHARRAWKNLLTPKSMMAARHHAPVGMGKPQFVVVRRQGHISRPCGRGRTGGADHDPHRAPAGAGQPLVCQRLGSAAESRPCWRGRTAARQRWASRRQVTRLQAWETREDITVQSSSKRHAPEGVGERDDLPISPKLPPSRLYGRGRTRQGIGRGPKRSVTPIRARDNRYAA